MASEGPETLAARVRRLRQLEGLTQEALAERAGLSVNVIGALERGLRRRLYPHTARVLADALGLSGAERTQLIDLAHGRRAAHVAAAAAPAPALAPWSPGGTTEPAGNLPATLTSFVGRERELTAAGLLIARGVRLLTLTGPGGVGKTRLAVEGARALRQHFPDGIWFVDLAPLADPALVPQAAAGVLGVREGAGRSLTDGLVATLRDRTALLVLDNCEHLLDACAALVASLLRNCPSLTLVATSRGSLGIMGEQIYPVPPLALPPVAESTGPWPAGAEHDAVLAARSSSADVGRLLEYPAVALFLERAQAARPDFGLTAANAPAVAEVCRRLDGLPLAIELAAARVRVLPPEQIAIRLTDRFRLLAGGARDALPRHQTLRALIDWSFGLLTEPEQALLRRLAVFAGGWTLEAAEAVCGDDEIEPWQILDLLTALVDQSLVVGELPAGEVRYRLLDTIREYALERLTASGEEGDARSRHLAYFGRLAVTAAPKLEWGAEQLAWLRRIERERDNLHAALAWAATGADPAAGQRLATSLWRFWRQRGLMVQGRRWLDWALRLPTDSSLRARLLLLIGQFDYWSGNMVAAQASLEAALALYRACDDTAEIAWTLHRLGITIAERGDPERGLALCEESVALCRTLDDDRGLAYALQTAGNVARMGGESDRPEAYAEEALALCRASENQLLTPYPLRQLLMVALTRGDDGRARALGEEALALAWEIEDPHAILSVTTDLLRLARRRRDLEATEVHGREGLLVLRRVGANQYAEAMLEVMAWAASERGQPERAAEVLGAASALRQSSGTSRDVLDRSAYAETLASVRAGAGEERFAAAWARGQSLSLSAAIAEALPPLDPAGEHSLAFAPSDQPHRGSVREDAN